MATRQPGAIDSRHNRLLSALPKPEYDQLMQKMEVVKFRIRDPLYRSNGPIDHVYFPTSGLISLVVTMEDGRTVEVGIAGKEGMVGVPVFLGAASSPAQVFWQAPGEAWRMRAAVFKAAVQNGSGLHTVLQRYVHFLLTQSSQSIACAHLHTVEERFAKWLLMTRDRLEADNFPLTQEFLAMMLGVRRASVTVAAGILQKAGMIEYHRGWLTILDREKLEEASCECYQAIRDELDRSTLGKPR